MYDSIAMGYEVQVNSPVYPALTMLHLVYCVIVYPTLTMLHYCVIVYPTLSMFYNIVSFCTPPNTYKHALHYTYQTLTNTRCTTQDTIHRHTFAAYFCISRTLHIYVHTLDTTYSIYSLLYLLSPIADEVHH